MEEIRPVAVEQAPLSVNPARSPLTSDERWIVGSLMLSMAVAALEQTVVSPAMPSIISELEGFTLYPWVFSAYLLATTVSTPLYGKLADLLGRKRLLLFGLVVFSLGSALSGMAWSMPSLILSRVVQGLGAGALMPIVLTILADAFSLERRARVQGWFSAVWGTSSLVGPAIGGVLTDRLSWRWVFFVTLPFSLFACVVLIRRYHEKPPARTTRHGKPLDWQGAALLTAGTTCLLMGLLNQQPQTHSIPTAAWLVASGLSLALLIAWERRAPDPILPLDLLMRPTVAAGILGSFGIGCLIFGIDTYIPLYIQGVLGGRATDAGRMLTPLFLSWSISVAIAARVVSRLGFQRTAMVGTGLISLGMAMLLVGTLSAEGAAWWFYAGNFVIGIGMGPTSLSYILAVQNVVAWERRGVATGAVSFFRTIGGAVGVAILGALLTWGLYRRVDDPEQAALLLASGRQDHAASTTAPTAELSPLARTGLANSIRDVVGAMLVLSIATLECARRLPGREPLPSTRPQSTAIPSSANIE